MKTIELTQKTKAGLAKALHRTLIDYMVHLAAEVGDDAEAERTRYEREITLWTPEEAYLMTGRKAWTISWEEGPFEWAPCLSGGSSLFAGEMGNWSQPGPIQILSSGAYVEPINNFQLAIWD